MPPVVPKAGLEWTLLFNVFFASIASRAFSEFYQSVVGDLDEDEDWEAARDSPSPPPTAPPNRHYRLRIGVFVSAFAFYIYDWIVLQLLYNRYPYSVANGLSYLRFANDLVMAFFLFAIVSTAATARVLERPFRLILCVSVWHVLAALWHILAQQEYSAHVNFDSSLRWHLLYVQGLYWITYAVYRHGILPCRLKGAADAAATTHSNYRWLLATEAIIIFAISTVRTFIVLASP